MCEMAQVNCMQNDSKIVADLSEFMRVIFMLPPDQISYRASRGLSMESQPFGLLFAWNEILL